MAEPYSMIELLRSFITKAGELGIEYMVTGSFAMSAYGEIRSTRDIDIVAHLDEKHIAPLVRAFPESFISATVPFAGRSRSGPCSTL